MITSAIECGVANSCFGGGSGLESCGDGECDLATEDALLCPEDCNAIGNPDLAWQCVVENCQAGQGAGSNNCSAGLQCLLGCQSTDCSVGCINNTQGGQNRAFLVSMMPCAVENKCVAESAWSVCGDGVCEVVETMLNCPEDCGEPPDAYLCIIDNCNVGMCPNFQGCNNALLCLSDCEDAKCAEDCMSGLGGGAANALNNALSCGLEQGCLPPSVGEEVPPECGDGNCEASESIAACPEDCNPDAKSCVGDCFQSLANVGCHCTTACEEQGNCCGDYAGFCQAGPFACIIENCPESIGCAQANMCSTALGCIAQSEGPEAAESCLEGQPNQNIPFLEDYIGCADDHDCYGAEVDPGPDPDPDQSPSECLVADCEAALNACAASTECLSTLPCIEDCKDAACIEQCAGDLEGDASALFISLFQCGIEKICF